MKPARITKHNAFKDKKQTAFKDRDEKEYTQAIWMKIFALILLHH